MKSSIQSKSAVGPYTDLAGGAVAGAAAGLVLTMMMTATALAMHHDVWLGIKGAAAPFLGVRTMEPGFDPFAVWLGFATHIAVSVGWAIPLAFLTSGMRREMTLAISAAWGLVVWIGMFYVILPAIGLSDMAHAAPLSRALAYHVFFGLAIGGGLVAWRQEEKRPNGILRPAFGHA